MRRVRRIPLDPATDAALARLSGKVALAADPAAEAKRLWHSKSTTTFRAVRQTLDQMAGGRSRCMYCEDSFGTDIEHFYPRVRYPKRAFSWVNYLLACSHCNSNLKRQLFPFIGRRPALIDPSRDDPKDHLVFLPSSGDFAAIGPKGQPSIEVFGLNDKASPRRLSDARKAAFLTLQVLLEEYDACLQRGDAKTAELARQAIRDEPFPAVLEWLVTTASGPAANRLLRPSIPRLVAEHSVATW